MSADYVKHACSRAWMAILAWSLFLLGSHLPAQAVHPSLCLSEPTGCDEPGSTINVEVVLGESDSIIVGAQFQISYDQEALTPFEVLPGAACDPDSPFSLEIHQSFDELTGTIFYAVGIDPFVGGSGTDQSATVACIRFLPRGVTTSNVCIEIGDQPTSTRLANDQGHLVPIDNSVSCPAGTAGALSCKEAFVKDVCRCSDDADCETLNHICCMGVCDVDTALCTPFPINQGAACDDLNECTTVDRCDAGVCRGFGCQNQSLCLGEECTPPQSHMVLPVLLGAGDPIITGGQFSIRWDPAGLELVSAQPGVACDPGSPFVLEIFRSQNDLEGELFYAVGIDPGGVGTQGPATLACLSFRVLDRDVSDICLFEDINPRLTKLVDDEGQFVDFFSDGTCSDPRGYPYINCQSSDFCEIPAASEWGLLALALGLLIAAKLRFRDRLATV